MPVNAKGKPMPNHSQKKVVLLPIDSKGQNLKLVPVANPRTKKTENLSLFDRFHDHTIGKIVPQHDEYLRAADFAKSDHVSWKTLTYIRVAFSYLLICNIMTTFWLNADGIEHMWWYFTYWGIAFTMFAMTYSEKAAMDPVRYQYCAMLWSECAAGFNFIIFPGFWILLAPGVFSRPCNTFKDYVTFYHLIESHTLPIIASMTHLYLVKGHVYIPRDNHKIMLLGILYTYFNYVGTKMEGHPMYPYADWSNFYETVALYVLMALMETYSYYAFANWICKKRGFKPSDY